MIIKVNRKLLKENTDRCSCTLFSCTNDKSINLYQINSTKMRLSEFLRLFYLHQTVGPEDSISRKSDSH